MKRFALLFVLFALIAIGVYSGWRYYQEDVLPERQISEACTRQLTLFRHIKPDVVISDASGQSHAASQDTDVSGTEEAPLLAAAAAVNPAVVGWLCIPGTQIDYPIVQAEDNDFYLHNGFDGEYNYEVGCPFLDYRCEPDFSGFNSIVYAHNMEGQQMFADVARYQEAGFLEGHSVGILTTPEGVHQVEFFAYLPVNSTAQAYHTAFVTQAERQAYLDYLFGAAQFCDPDAGALGTDVHLLLLSTCTFLSAEARGVLVGVIQ